MPYGINMDNPKFDLGGAGAALAEPVIEEAAALWDGTGAVRPQAMDDFLVIAFQDKAQGNAQGGKAVLVLERAVCAGLKQRLDGSGVSVLGGKH